MKRTSKFSLSKSAELPIMLSRIALQLLMKTLSIDCMVREMPRPPPIEAIFTSSEIAKGIEDAGFVVMNSELSIVQTI